MEFLIFFPWELTMETLIFVADLVGYGFFPYHDEGLHDPSSKGDVLHSLLEPIQVGNLGNAPTLFNHPCWLL